MDEKNPIVFGAHEHTETFEERQEEVVQKTRRVAHTIATVIFFVLLITISVGGYFLYNSFYAPGVSLTSRQEDGYSLLVPSRYEKTRDDVGADVYYDPALGIETSSIVRVQQLYTIVGDRASYIADLDELTTKESVQDAYNVDLEEGQNLVDIVTKSDPDTLNHEYWQFSASIEQSGRTVGYLTVRLRATESKLYAVSVLTRLGSDRLDESATDIAATFTEI